ncbi:hypothetical protein [Thomasclavelia cocleata]|uniref:hypothetical protein n=1 Tax=Thomasclavelia cocleata TaxID=69824 RepID=UPI002433361C|nr:hypothetical protein [Thomasclavelia cocleata]
MNLQERNQERQELIDFAKDLQVLKREHPKITEHLKTIGISKNALILQLLWESVSNSKSS